MQDLNSYVEKVIQQLEQKAQEELRGFDEHTAQLLRQAEGTDAYDHIKQFSELSRAMLVSNQAQLLEVTKQRLRGMAR